MPSDKRLWDSIKTLKGIGDVKLKSFKKLGISTVLDLLMHIPVRYEDRRKISSIVELKNAEIGTIKAFVVSSSQSYNKKYRRGMIRVVVDDGTQKSALIFVNSPHLIKYFKTSEEFYIYGKISKDVGIPTFFYPEYLSAIDNPKGFGIEMIYSMCEGISQKDIRKSIFQALDYSNELDSLLPVEILNSRGYLKLSEAIYNLHMTDNLDILEKSKITLIYYEFFTLSMAISYMKNYLSSFEKKRKYVDVDLVDLRKKFKFELTEDQKKAISDIYEDMRSAKVMNRLLQGDVGSGKTAVSISAAYIAAKSGYQVAIMSPTEILSYQHFENFQSVLGNEFEVVHLSSSSKKKKEILSDIQTGIAKIVISTHSVLSEKVQFDNLALVVTDEQHRFGVEQRRTIANKGEDIDVLVMSATPIPRTLSLILYGDMSISEIKQKPKHRIPIKTFYISKDKILDMYGFIREKLDKNERAYFVAPTIEDSDILQLNSVNSLYEILVKEFKDYGVEMLHSNISNSQKDEIMNKFKLGEIKVIVSTTVIEVGIDVPEATMMIIINSERFGLSQLHQLRGRVGRGRKQSYCFLLADKIGEISRKRIETMIATDDGFEIAKKDLEIRGPGEFIGTTQHGMPTFKIADLTNDMEILIEAKEDVEKYIGNMDGYELSQKLSANYLDWINSKLVL